MLVAFGTMTRNSRSRFLTLLFVIALCSVALHGQTVRGKTKDAATASLHVQANIVGGVFSPARPNARTAPDTSIQYNIDSLNSTSKMDVHEVFSTFLPIASMEPSAPAGTNILKTIVLVSK